MQPPVTSVGSKKRKGKGTGSRSTKEDWKEVKVVRLEDLPVGAQDHIYRGLKIYPRNYRKGTKVAPLFFCVFDSTGFSVCDQQQRGEGPDGKWPYQVQRFANGDSTLLASSKRLQQHPVLLAVWQGCGCQGHQCGLFQLGEAGLDESNSVVTLDSF